MAITYTVDNYEETDKSVKVTFTNSEGLVHERYVNIPHNEDGTVNEEYFQEILEGQLRGVENKLVIGVITFAEPNQNVGIASTSVVGIASTSIV